MEIIAYYLPQYYPFKENNEWWGEGFTEWTNVGKAKSLFWGHEQPKIPRDLGYYDLRIEENRIKQAELAKLAGVTAFCYWHYWFGNGKLLLDMPINEVLKSGKPDFPFCLGWANESWMAKTWSSRGIKKDKLLIEQLYPDENDYINHYNYIKKFILDKRYLRIEDRPVFVVYKPFLIPDIIKFMSVWNKMIKSDHIAESFFFIAHTLDEQQVSKLLSMGFDAVNIVRIGAHRYDKRVIKRIVFKLFLFKFLHFPLVLNYSFISKYFVNKIDYENNVFGTIIPNWDHTPRSGKRGVVFYHSTPKLFEKHLIQIFETIRNKPKVRQILFLKSWNEWGEGNYMEPDLKFGRAYINTLSKVKKLFCSSK